MSTKTALDEARELLDINDSAVRGHSPGGVYRDDARSTLLALVGRLQEERDEYERQARLRARTISQGDAAMRELEVYSNRAVDHLIASKKRVEHLEIQLAKSRVPELEREARQVLAENETLTIAKHTLESQLAAATEWRDMESAPQDVEAVLLLLPVVYGSVLSECHIGFCDASESPNLWTVYEDDGERTYPTSALRGWLPLPAPPQGQEASE